MISFQKNKAPIIYRPHLRSILLTYCKLSDIIGCYEDLLKGCDQVSLLKQIENIYLDFFEFTFSNYWRLILFLGFSLFHVTLMVIGYLKINISHGYGHILIAEFLFILIVYMNYWNYYIAKSNMGGSFTDKTLMVVKMFGKIVFLTIFTFITTIIIYPVSIVVVPIHAGYMFFRTYLYKDA